MDHHAKWGCLGLREREGWQTDRQGEYHLGCGSVDRAQTYIGFSTWQQAGWRDKKEGRLHDRRALLTRAGRARMGRKKLAFGHNEQPGPSHWSSGLAGHRFGIYQLEHPQQKYREVHETLRALRHRKAAVPDKRQVCRPQGCPSCTQTRSLSFCAVPQQCT